MKQPLIIAHTGCEGTPDNTLESCLAGKNAGCDILEVDVQATKDGVCVLFHDEHPAFSSFTYEELLQQNPLQLEAGRHLEKLENVLLEWKGNPVSFNLDIKNDDAALPVLELLKSLNMWDQIYFTGATDLIMDTPFHSRIMWNTPSELGEMDSAQYEAAAHDICTRVKQADCAGINVDYPSCRASLVRIAHEHDLQVWIYTLSDGTGFETFAAMNVDAVSTLDVSGLVALRIQVQQDQR